MASSDGVALVDMINGAMEFTVPIVHRMGIKAVEAERGHAAATVPIEGNGNHFGVMYAGVLFAVAEMLGGVLAVATFDNARFFPLVKNVDIAFVGMARSDVRAEVTLDEESIARVESEADANGKSDFILDAVVTDADGQVVATTHGLYQLRAHSH